MSQQKLKLTPCCGVCVCIKVSDHHKIVILALEAGKHILCEWRLCERICRRPYGWKSLAKQQPCCCESPSLDLQIHATPNAKSLRDLIESGYIMWWWWWWWCYSPQPGLWIYNTFVHPSGPHAGNSHLGARRRVQRPLLATLANQHKRVTPREGGDQPPAPKTSEGQVLIQGTLTTGAVASVHHRRAGGRARHKAVVDQSSARLQGGSSENPTWQWATFIWET